MEQLVENVAGRAGAARPKTSLGKLDSENFRCKAGDQTGGLIESYTHVMLSVTHFVGDPVAWWVGAPSHLCQPISLTEFRNSAWEAKAVG